jgi:aminoglycoside phosphotransferase (APT) family kinase protein
MQTDQVKALKNFISKQSENSELTIHEFRQLSGGAVQENWLLNVHFADGPFVGSHEWVLRGDSPSAGVAMSHGRSQEFALLSTAFNAGVTVPKPLWLCEDLEIIGRPFFIMQRVKGTAAGHVLVKDMSLGGNRIQLARRLGQELARIHSIRPPVTDLGFLEWYEEPPAIRLINQHRRYLDRHPSLFPSLEWGLRWLERHAPPRGELVLSHRDFRTGNYMVDESGLTGILDWEFAGWSDPLEDIGWFCAKCWRFGQIQSEAGGIGRREDFYAGYEEETGSVIPKTEVHYWEVMAHMNWAIIALQQAERQASGTEDSLLLALTGHIVPELEWEILNLTEAN